jgi:uncharacterized membrane protein
MVGVALGVGASFANFVLARATRDMQPSERAQFMLRASAVGKNGSYGLVLLLLSGIGMTVLRGIPETFAWGGGAFHAKLTLVAVLVGFFGYVQMLVKRAKKEGGGPALGTLGKIGPVMVVLGLAIVLSAVLAFH